MMNFFDKLFGNNKNYNNNNYNDKKVNYQNCLNLYLNKKNIKLDSLKTIFIVEESFLLTRNNCKIIAITGKVEKGNIKIGDELYYVDENMQLIPVNILGIEKFRQQFEEAYAGDLIGMTVDISKKLPANLYLFKV